MNFDTNLDPTATELLIAYLSKRHGVKPPKIKFSRNRGTRGTYYDRRALICVSKQTKVWVVAHEFTHYLNHKENGKSVDHEPHSHGFFHKLRRVAASIGSEAEYPWHKEYRQLHRWAKAKGIATPDATRVPDSENTEKDSAASP